MSMVTASEIDALVTSLRGLLPDGVITRADEALDRYTADSYWKAIAYRHRGTPLGRPNLLARPTTEAQVATILRVACEHRVPVVPWGGGSGSQGGAVPTRGGLVLDLRELNQIIDIDEDSYTVTVQAGMNGADFERDLNARGLTFPHYPASAELATVGGYVAARGSGVLSTRYGKIEDLTVSMQVAMPNGALVDLLPVPRHAVGPDLSSLIIGSEGTLGVITRVTVQIIRLPPARLFACIAFDSVEAGVEAYREAMVRGYRPAVIRLYDRVGTEHTLRPVLDGAAEMGEGVVSIMTFEGEKPLADAERLGALDILQKHGARELDPHLAEHWWQHRYDFYREPFYPSLPQVWGTFDIVAPYKRLMSAYYALQESVAKPYAKYGLQLRTHFSHWYPWGAMYYARFVMPDPGADVLQIHDQIWKDGMAAVVEAGGLLNDHHGVGIKLAPWMRVQHGDALDVLRSIKHALDPAGIMNPGKLAMDSGDPT